MTSPEIDRRGSQRRADPAWPHRRALALLAGLTSIAGIAGSIQLLAGVATPPAGDLPPGLSTWVLPGLWLLASVGIPSCLAAVLVWRRSPWGPPAALVAAAALTLELLVQIPFIGLSVLQLVFGLVAAAMALLAIRARRGGWPPAAR
jgi:hypothetical protein